MKKYGVVSNWGETKIVWYETLSQAFNNAAYGEIVIEKIEEL